MWVAGIFFNRFKPGNTVRVLETGASGVVERLRANAVLVRTGQKLLAFDPSELGHTGVSGNDDKRYPRTVNFGKIWASSLPNSSFIGLNGFRFGGFAAIPYGQHAPYLHGELYAEGPVVEKVNLIPGVTAKENRITQWCGFITTDVDQTKAGDGVIYTGRLEVDPLPLLFARKKAETDDNGAYRYSVVLRIEE